MTQLTEKSLVFNFPAGWSAAKYDEWSFYKNQFIKMFDGIKAVDILAINDNVLWMIEVKDYRTNYRTKTCPIHDEVARKVFCTLASILPASVNSSDADEKAFAKKALKAAKIAVVLHLEQPTKTSKMFPRAFDPANIQIKLRSILKSVDAHPKVVEISSMTRIPWSVT